MAAATPAIVEQHGSHILVRRGDCFAVVERRNGRIYDLRSAAREGHPDTPSGIAAAIGAGGWTDEANARAAFSDAVARGDRLAERLR